MQDKLIEAAQHVVDEMERGYPILGAVCRLKEALAAESTAQLDGEDADPVEDVATEQDVQLMFPGLAWPEEVRQTVKKINSLITRKGYYSLEDMEKAILAQARGFQVIPVDELPEFLKQALAPKPSLAAKTGGAK